MKISRLSKYGGIIAIILILITPPILNWALSRPAFCRIVGTDTDWLSFYGGYIGSVISSMVAFFILHQQLKNNHEENRKNRDIQRNIIKYQQEKEWLDRLRSACIENITAYDTAPLYHIAGIMLSNPDQAKTELEQLSNKIQQINLQIEILGYNDMINDPLIEFHKKRTKAVDEYHILINDIRFIWGYAESIPLYNDLEYGLSVDLVSRSTYDLIKHTQHADKQSFKLLVFNLLKNYSLNKDVLQFTLNYLNQEKIRLNQILLQNEG